MIKTLHVVAICTLIASAFHAYRIKYETLYQHEQVAKLRQQVLRERSAIAVLKAEWQHLNRPDRLQRLAERHLATVPLSIHQIVRLQDVPIRGPRVDELGRKLEAFGLADPAPTASLPRPSSARPNPR